MIRKEIIVNVNTGNAEKELADLKRKLSDIENVNVVVNVETEGDTADAKAEAEKIKAIYDETLSNIETNVSVEVEIDSKKAEKTIQSLDSKLKKSEGTSIDYKKSLDETGTSLDSVTVAAQSTNASLENQAALSMRSSAETMVLNEQITESEVRLKQLNIELAREEELSTAAGKSTKALQHVLNDLDEEEANLAKLKKKRNAEDTKLMNKRRKGLEFSLAQITREAPAFLYSVEMGFMAISNNIPIFVDNLNQTKEALSDTGKTSVNMWKEVGKALFSWQTLLSLGVVALTQFAPIIFKAVGKFMDLNSEADKFKKTLEDSKEEEILSKKQLANIDKLIKYYELKGKDTNEQKIKKIMDLQDRQLNLENRRVAIQKEYERLQKKGAKGSIWGDPLSEEEVKKVKDLAKEFEDVTGAIRDVKIQIEELSTEDIEVELKVKVTTDDTSNTKKNRDRVEEIPLPDLFGTTFAQDEERIKNQTELYKTAVESQGLHYKTLEELSKEHQKEMANIEMKGIDRSVKANEKIVESTEDKIRAASQMASGMAELSDAIVSGYDIEMQRLEEKGEKDSEAYRELEKKKEKAAIGGVVMDTASAIIGTWAGYATMGPWGTAAAIAQTVGILATGIAQIKAIKSKKLDTGASGGGAPPVYNVIAENQYNPINDQLGVLTEIKDGVTAPTRAYVVSKDISTQQALDRQIESGASI